MPSFVPPGLCLCLPVVKCSLPGPPSPTRPGQSGKAGIVCLTAAPADEGSGVALGQRRPSPALQLHRSPAPARAPPRSSSPIPVLRLPEFLGTPRQSRLLCPGPTLSSRLLVPGRFCPRTVLPSFPLWSPCLTWEHRSLFHGSSWGWPRAGG